MSVQTINTMQIGELSPAETTIEVSPQLEGLFDPTNPYGQAYLATLGRLGIEHHVHTSEASSQIELVGTTEATLQNASQLTDERADAIALASAELVPHDFQRASQANIIRGVLSDVLDLHLPALTPDTPFSVVSASIATPFARKLRHPSQPLHVWGAEAEAVAA